MSTTEEPIVAAEVLQAVDSLYQAGQYLSAYEAGSVLGPLAGWAGTQGRLLAGRLATNLGSPRLGQALVRLAWRNDRESLYAGYFHTLVMFRSWGPLRTWKTLRGLGDYASANESLRADWHGLWAHVLAALRDHDRAERHLEQALELSPNRPWTWVQRSAILTMGDRPEEALAASRKAMELRPFYRPAVQSMASGLLDLGRDQEALSLLTEAATQLECGDVIAHLAAVQIELRLYVEARESYERLAQYYPLMDKEKHLRGWLTSRRSDAAYFCGDFVTAAALAREVPDSENYQAFAKRLEESTDGKRQMLNVGFVRQNRETCAPATLAAISGYWRVPADHEEIAREICYDGTPGHHERQWAEDHGFVVREFRCTWESVTALLDRGVPLTLTTVNPGNAHLQAIIGYDDRRRTLLVRDPSVRTYAEYDADELLKQYRANGPRGMVMIPATQASLLDGIELPDEAMFHGSHHVNRLLEKHDRPAAQQIYEEMLAKDPEHPLVHRARWSLTGYDGDVSGGLECVEALLKAYPDDVNLLMAKLSIYRELGRREERTQLLKSLCATTNCHPLLLGDYAAELSEDARAFDDASHLLRRVIRYRPMEGQWYGLWGDLLWGRESREEALELYRFAACLNDKHEGQSWTYFIASRHLRFGEAALQFLRERFARLGALSGQPARTLAWAFDQLNTYDDLFATLDAALKLRPDDADLLLFAADYHARYGRQSSSDELLQRAQGKCHPGQWLRQAARLATYRGQPREALDCWQRALADQPLDGEAQSETARLLADLEGRPAAIAQIRAAIARFPHHYRLRRLLIEWLYDETPSVHETEVRELLARHANDAWAHRELAIVLMTQGRWEEASASAETAHSLESANPIVHWIRGRILQGHGRTREARLAMREAIRHSVDYQHAIEGLMNLCDTNTEREEELRFVRGELERQVIFGDGLLAFREHAAHTWGPQATLAMLQEALAARPDLWHAHSAVIRQLIAMDQAEAARTAGREAVRRFPLLPRIWLDLAAACQACNDASGEIEALEEALKINPGWGEASCALAEAHQRQGNLDRARQLLQTALIHEPQSARIHATLADLLWTLPDQPAAIEAMKRAAELAPENDWIWKRLREWLSQLEHFDEVLELARQATQLRPHSAALWIILSEIYGSVGRNEEAIEALDRVLALDPRHADSHSLRAYYLGQQGRWDDARAACRPAIFGDDVPLMLQSREAHLIWQSGERREAVERMRSVVAQDPQYYWAWTRLADWYDELSDTDKYLEAAQHLTRIAPKLGQSHGYEGHARLRSDDRAGAKESLKQALALLPDYRFASETLFDVQLGDGDLDGADETRIAAAPHYDPATQMAWRICLAAAGDYRAAALNVLGELCTTPQVDSLALEKAVGALMRAGLQVQAATQLQSKLELADCDPQVGRVWVSLLAFELGQWARCAKQLKRMKTRGPLWHLACQRYVERPAVLDGLVNIEVSRIIGFARTNRRSLQENVDSWSAVGEALLRVGRPRRTVRWMKDWRNRSDAQPRHLLALAEAMWGLGQEAAAIEVSRYAMQLPADPWKTGHQLLLAIGQVKEGNYRKAEGQLRELDWRQMGGMYQSLYNLLYEGVVRQQYAQIDWRTARTRLRKEVRALGKLGVHQLLLKRAVLICRWRIARDHGRIIRASWYRWLGWLLNWGG